MLLRGDCLEQLKTLEENSIHSLVTDPPAGISFMGKEWDHGQNFVERMSEIYKECLRVLKPGAHGLVWALPRTSHWTATALEQAGFEIRDVITHVFGSGFPKSLDISKAIDKAAGAEREVVGDHPNPSGKLDVTYMAGNPETTYGWQGDAKITKPATSEAQQWQGWGTALKPASEHWILVRKKYNIDPCEEIVLSAIPNTQLTMHGLNEAEALLVHMLVESSLDPAQKAKILCVGRAVNGLDMTVMSQLTSVVESIDLNIVSSWKNISDEDLEKVKTFITSMVTRRITESRISNSSQSPNTLDCIKPNSEHYILIRKPLSEKTVAANVLKHGTGGINIDECRVQGKFESGWSKSGSKASENLAMSGANYDRQPKPDNPQGRFPSNFVLSHNEDCDECCTEGCAVKALDEQSGFLKGPGNKNITKQTKEDTEISFNGKAVGIPGVNIHCDSGGASRFFYVAKASKKDRNEGLDGLVQIEVNNSLCKEENTALVALLQKVTSELMVKWSIAESGKAIMARFQKGCRSTIKTEINRIIESKILNSLLLSLINENIQDVNFETENGGSHAEDAKSLKEFLLTITQGKSESALGVANAILQTLRCVINSEEKPFHNFHSTVKSTKLMEYLITLITPPGGTVLDPFMGSGSTGVAAKRLGFEFIGIEQNEEYFEIAERRVEHEIHKTRAHI